MIKKIIQKSLAVLLVAAMVAGTVFSDNVFTLNAYATEASGGDSGSGASGNAGGSGDSGDSGDAGGSGGGVTEPEIKDVELTFQLPASADLDTLLANDVGLSKPKVKVYYQASDGDEKETGTVEFTDSEAKVTVKYAVDDSYTYRYELFDNNYKIELKSTAPKISSFIGNTNAISLGVNDIALTPDYTMGAVEGPDSLELEGTGEYTISTGSTTWDDQVEWSISGTDAASVEFVDASGAAAATATGNSCRLKVKAGKMPDANTDELNVTLTATGADGQTTKKNIKITKKSTTLSLTFNPEKEGAWDSPVTITPMLKSGDKVIAGDISVAIKDAHGKEAGSLTDNADGTFSWTPGSIQEYTITASYTGSESYTSSTREDIYIPGKVNQSFSFKGGDKIESIAYGETFYINPEAIAADAGKPDTSTEFSFEVPDTYKDSITIKEKEEGKGYPVTVNTASGTDVKISVIQNENENYNASTGTFTIGEITKKEVTLEQVKATDRVYDGKTEVTVSAKLVAVYNGVSTEVGDITAIGNTQSPDAGEKKPVTVTFKLSGELANHYNLSDAKPDKEVMVTINKKKIGLTVGDASMEYTKTDNVKNLQYDNGAVPVTVNNQDFVGDDNEANLKDFSLPEVVIDTNVIGQTPIVKKYEAALVAKEGTGNATANYEFNFENQIKGILTLLPEKVDESTAWKYYVNINVAGSSHVYQKETTVYYALFEEPEKSTVAKIKPVGDTYTKVFQVEKDDEGNISKKTDITDIGVDAFPEDGIICLQLSDDKGEQLTEPFEVRFTKDASAPMVTIKENDGESIASKIVNTLTFNIFRNKNVELTVSMSDDNSGINTGKTRYYKVPTVEDIDPDNYTDFLKDINNDITDQVKEGKITLDAEVNGNYVIFVYAEDMVGNGVYYSSTGIVLDTTFEGPIQINYDEKSQGKSVINDNDSMDYFNDDISLNVTVNGNQGSVFSGVDSVTYSMTQDGKVVDIEDNELFKAEDKQKENTTIAQLGKDFETVTGEMSANVDANTSKEILVNVNAVDFAGNEASASKTFVIDKLAPEVLNTLSYDKEPHVDSNGKSYTNANVTLTTTITERYFSYANVVYSINGENDLSLSSLLTDESTWPKYGIQKITAEPIGDIKNRNDKSQTVVTIEFGNKEDSGFDKDYDVSVKVTDFAGNESESDDKFAFTIDKVRPVVKVYYTNNKDNQNVAVKPSKDEKHPTYYNQESYPDSVTANIHIEERNFSKDGLTRTITAEDVSGKSIADVVGEESLTEGENTHTLAISLVKDARYTVDVAYTDLAGNKAAFEVSEDNADDDYKTDYFVVDRKVPSGSVTISGLQNIEGGKKVWTELLTAITFGWFGKDSVFASMDGSDEIAGVASVQYYVPAYTADNKGKILSAADLAGKPWENYKEPLEYSANQNIVVYEKVTDFAGNYAYFSSENVVIDDTQMTIAITPDAEIPAYNKGIYSASDARQFIVTVEDPVDPDVEEDDAKNKDQYAGIKNVSYKMFDDTKQDPVQSNEALMSDALKDGTTHHVQTQTQTVDLKEYVSKNLNHSYDCKIQVTAVDYSGNISNAEEAITIDPVAPVVTNTYTSDAEKINGKYYKSDVTLTTTITERFLDLDNDVYYTIHTVKHVDGKDEQVTETVAFKDLKQPANWSKYGISNVTWEQDTSDEARDGAQTTITITFSDERDYQVATDVTDKAGNQKTTENYEFVVDKTAPRVQVAYKALTDSAEHAFAAGTKDDIAYLGEAYTKGFGVTITVTELNFFTEFSNGSTSLKDPYLPQYTVTAKDSKKIAVLEDACKLYKSNAVNSAEWSANDIVRTFEAGIQNDANYTFDFTYTDLAGNACVFVDSEGKEHNTVPTDYITLDRVRPSGTVSVSGLVNGTGNANGGTQQTWADQLISTITFGLFGKNNLSSTVTSDDVTAGVDQTWYMLSSKTYDWQSLDNLGANSWTLYKGKINLPANQNVIVYEKVEDKAGNRNYFSSANLVADNTDPAPVVTITPSKPAWGKGVYSAGDNPGFDIRVEDPSVNGAYSGLKEVTYRIYDGANGHENTGTLATYSNKDHKQVYTGHVTINPTEFYSNDVRVTVSASDWSTNQTTSTEQKLKIDNQAPVVKFSFDQSDAQNSKYYKNTKTLTITVNERNFDTSYTPKVTASNGGGYSFNGWSVRGEVATGTVTFSGDGDYSVTFDCYDLAGNKSNTEKMDEITIDKTLPTISVSYDNNNSQNGNYYKSERTATITITEHNFRASEVKVTTTANNGAAAPSVSGWSGSGDRHTAVIRFANDADYTFDIAYTDLAGNASADYAEDKFTVDLTKPVIEISGVKNKQAIKGTVEPVFRISDRNFDANGVTYTLRGVNKGKIDTGSMISVAATNDGQIVTFRNFANDMDDIYTLTVKEVDKAGNEETQEITFSVNRNGSTYTFSNETQNLLNSGFTKTAQDIVVHEINVNEPKNIEISYSKNGTVVKLAEGTDYTVQKTGGNGQWWEVTYTIKASCFEDEGEYSLNIYSEDEAGNTTTNKVKGKTLDFIVDKTAPTVAVSNLEDRASYLEDTHDFTMTVSDNTTLAYVEVYLDGELWKTIPAEDLLIEDGTVTISIDNKTSWQTVKLIAYDAAGNAAESVEYSVLVTPSRWVQFYMNKPLFFGSIAVIVLLAGLIIFLIAKRRKKEEQE